MSAPGTANRLDGLPTLVVIGAMKAGTSALHDYLDAHPDVAMSRPKELNFFNGPSRPPDADPSGWWRSGQWHRGVDWYRRQFDRDAPVRGEASPAYTSPDFPEAAERMAAVIPDVRLLYVVRDPFRRALSQYAHHVRDGSESRPVDEALLDPQSHYIQRSRYVERLRPYLARFEAEQLHVVVQERLLERRREEMARVFEHVGVDPAAVEPAQLDRLVHVGGVTPEVDDDVRDRFIERVADDVAALRDLLHDPLEEWTST